MSKIIATWNISLNCECPHCHNAVDLLDDPDFFDGRSLQIGEHETPLTTDMDVVCPSCGEDFDVDLEY